MPRPALRCGAGPCCAALRCAFFRIYEQYQRSCQVPGARYGICVCGRLLVLFRGCPFSVLFFHAPPPPVPQTAPIPTTRTCHRQQARHTAQGNQLCTTRSSWYYQIASCTELRASSLFPLPILLYSSLLEPGAEPLYVIPGRYKCRCFTYSNTNVSQMLSVGSQVLLVKLFPMYFLRLHVPTLAVLAAFRGVVLWRQHYFKYLAVQYGTAPTRCVLGFGIADPASTGSISAVSTACTRTLEFSNCFGCLIAGSACARGCVLLMLPVYSQRFDRQDRKYSQYSHF